MLPDFRILNPIELEKVEDFLNKCFFIKSWCKSTIFLLNYKMKIYFYFNC